MILREGPTGSAVQRLFMQEVLTAQQLAGPLADTGVLLLHAVNPWGFAQYRRVTENNVDLNRNASADAALYHTVNAGYPLLGFGTLLTRLSYFFTFMKCQGPNSMPCMTYGWAVKFRTWEFGSSPMYLEIGGRTSVPSAAPSS